MRSYWRKRKVEHTPKMNREKTRESVQPTFEYSYSPRKIEEIKSFQKKIIIEKFILDVGMKIAIIQVRLVNV